MFSEPCGYILDIIMSTALDKEAENMPSNTDPYHLDRFIIAQDPIIERVLMELGNGRKLTHWMWFIFPQMHGLGHSATAQFYAIKSEAEARQYLRHPILGARLLKCAETVLAVKGKSITTIFDSPDDMKLKSSMTLFSTLTDPGSVFERVLEKHFDGKRDTLTLGLLKKRAK